MQFIYEAQSKPTVEWIKERYKKYNQELFDNELPNNIRLGLISKKTDSLGWQGFDVTYWMRKKSMENDMYIMYYFPQGEGNARQKYDRKRNKWFPDLDEAQQVENIMVLKPFIELNPKYTFSDFQKEDTLIHEMIHLWVHRDGLAPKRAHGKEFKAKCNEIRKKAKKLYGIEYELSTYAGKESDDENTGYSSDKEKSEIEKDILDKISKAAKRGGGVWSIYAIYDISKVDPKLRNFRHRFMFCTKNKLEHVINQVANSRGVKEVWVSSTSFEKMCRKYGMFSTVQNYCKFWDTGSGEYDENILLEDAQEVYKSRVVKAYESCLNEGLGSKIKSWLKRIMSAVLMITKGTPSSEIDNEDLLNKIENIEDEEIEGSVENEKRSIEIKN